MDNKSERDNMRHIWDTYNQKPRIMQKLLEFSDPNFVPPPEYRPGDEHLLDQRIKEMFREEDEFDTPQDPQFFSEYVYKFNPEGEGYDYKSAKEAGLGPNEEGHWPSRVPQTGLLLKGKKHETWDLLKKEERKAGHMIFKRDGRYYSLTPEDLTREAEIAAKDQRKRLLEWLHENIRGVKTVP
jgi:hypothetical protein